MPIDLEPGQVPYKEAYSTCELFAALVCVRDNIPWLRSLARTRAYIEKMLDGRPPKTAAAMRVKWTTPDIPPQRVTEFVEFFRRLTPEQYNVEWARILKMAPEEYTKSADAAIQSQNSFVDQRELAHFLHESTRGTDPNIECTREYILGAARSAYERTIGADPTKTVDAGSFFRGALAFIQDRMKADPPKADFWQATLIEDLSRAFLHATAWWYESGCPIVRINAHSYGAALGATSLSPDVEPTLPWPTFLLELPDGLIPESEPGTFTRYILVHTHHLPSKISFRWDDDPTKWSGPFDSGSKNWEIHAFPNLVRLGEGHKAGRSWGHMVEGALETSEDGPMPVTSADARRMQICQRIAFNACMAITDPDALRPTRSASNGGKAKRHGPPEGRVYILGRPTTIDCRLAISEYVNHGAKSRGPLTIQFITRGHWRHQPHGPGRLQRRLQWIEPHWKGPPNAPIAVRPKVVGPTAESPEEGEMQ